MPPHPDAPLRKTTLNLYLADVSVLERHYGFGWSEQVRQIVHRHVQTLSKHKTIEDLVRDQGT